MALHPSGRSSRELYDVHFRGSSTFHLLSYVLLVYVLFYVVIQYDVPYVMMLVRDRLTEEDVETNLFLSKTTA